MSLSQEAIDLAVQKKYSAFAEVVKTQMVTKMAEHPVAQEYIKEFDGIKNMKSTLANLNQPAEA